MSLVASRKREEVLYNEARPALCVRVYLEYSIRIRPVLERRLNLAHRPKNEFDLLEFKKKLYEKEKHFH